MVAIFGVNRKVEVGMELNLVKLLQILRPEKTARGFCWGMP